MKPIDQVEPQECLRACVASVFELPIEEVPIFGVSAIETPREALVQDQELRQWLALRGLSLEHVTSPSILFANGAKSARAPWGICIAGGKSPRGDFGHAIVYDAREGDPKMMHDPHPSKAGFAGEPDYFTCFYVEDPALFARKVLEDERACKPSPEADERPSAADRAAKIVAMMDAIGDPTNAKLWRETIGKEIEEAVSLEAKAQRRAFAECLESLRSGAISQMEMSLASCIGEWADKFGVRLRVAKKPVAPSGKCPHCKTGDIYMNVDDNYACDSCDWTQFAD